MGVACPVLAWVLAPGGTGKPAGAAAASPRRSTPAGAAPACRPHDDEGSPGCSPRSPAAPGRWPPARRTHSPLRGGRSWPAHRGSRCALLRRQTAVALAGVAAEAERLQVADGVGAALAFGDDVVHLQGALVLVRAAALAAAPGAGGRPVHHRAADRAAVAAAVGKHFFAALLAQGIEALAAELQQRVALPIAQRVAADQAVVAIAIGGAAVEGEPGPPCACQDPASHVLRGGGGMGESWRV